MGKVTDDMVRRGLEACYSVDPSVLSSNTLEACSSDIAKVYLAMRAARPRKQRKAEQDATPQKPVVDREAVAEQLFMADRGRTHFCDVSQLRDMNEATQLRYLYLADAAIAALGAVAVPEEATTKMIGAALAMDRSPSNFLGALWRTMLAAWREETK